MQIQVRTLSFYLSFRLMINNAHGFSGNLDAFLCSTALQNIKMQCVGCRLRLCFSHFIQHSLRYGSTGGMASRHPNRRWSSCSACLPLCTSDLLKERRLGRRSARSAETTKSPSSAWHLPIWHGNARTRDLHVQLTLKDSCTLMASAVTPWTAQASPPSFRRYEHERQVTWHASQVCFNFIIFGLFVC